MIRKSISRTLTTTSLLCVLIACSPSNTKITAWPDRIPVKRPSVILICPVAGVPEDRQQILMNLGADKLTKENGFLEIANYWNTLFQAKQLDIDLPIGIPADTADLKSINQKLEIDLLLLAQVDKIRTNDTDELSNPDYHRREAIVSLTLIDLHTTQSVWHCTTRIFVNPFNAYSKTQKYSLNVLSGDYAVTKAYKESIRALSKSFTIVK